MPRLLLLVACEKVLSDDATKAPTLVGILQGVQVDLKPGQTVDANSTVPLRWCVYSMWRLDEGEPPAYDIRAQLMTADGKILLESAQKAIELTGEGKRASARFLNFPVGQAGELQVRVSYRAQGTNGNWVEAGSYPIRVTHKQTS